MRSGLFIVALLTLLVLAPTAQADDVFLPLVTTPGVAPADPPVAYPRQASAFGLHDTPIPGGSVDLDRAIEDWQSLGVAWVTVLDPRDELLARASKAGIQVIARVYSRSVFEDGDFGGTARRMVAHGMHYVVPYNEPNLRAECAGNWPDPVAFAARWVAAADAILQQGAYPVLTPLAPEGDYPDMAYLDSFLSEVLKLRGQAWLRDSHVVVGMHAYVLRPGDSFFNRVRAYEDAVKTRMGLDLPILITEGGIAPAALHRGFIWSPEAETIALAQALRDGSLPPYILGATLWLYSNSGQGGHDPRFEDSAWFGTDGPGTIALAIQADAIKQALRTERLFGGWTAK